MQKFNRQKKCAKSLRITRKRSFSKVLIFKNYKTSKQNRYTEVVSKEVNRDPQLKLVQATVINVAALSNMIRNSRQSRMGSKDILLHRAKYLLMLRQMSAVIKTTQIPKHHKKNHPKTFLP